MILTYQILTIKIKALDTLALPHYKGSTFRGGFGNVFKRVVCALKRQDCKDCLLKTKCIYAYVFETFPGEDTELMNMKKYEKIPHPFLIEPPMETQNTFNPEETLMFNLILIGKATDYLPYFIYTFDELGKTGIGKGRGRYQLLEVKKGNQLIYTSGDKIIRHAVSDELNIDEIFDFENSDETTITLNFVTPARISYNRGLTTELKFHILIRSLLRRILLLHYFHCKKTLPLYDHKKIIKEAEDVTIDSNSLRWWDWDRFSSRQNTKMKMGGILGKIKYRGNIRPFLDILKAGETFHVGKGTGFGLGKYLIE